MCYVLSFFFVAVYWCGPVTQAGVMLGVTLAERLLVSDSSLKYISLSHGQVDARCASN